MTIYQPATPHSDSIIRPPCGKCGNRMLLAGLEPDDEPGYEKRTFECIICKNIESFVVEYK